MISTVDYNDSRPDVIVLALTSQLSSDGCVVTGWEEAGLLKPSMMKPIIATIERERVIKRLGSMTATDQDGLSTLLSEMIGR